jgi:prepilin-type N-terminal cleavage/methylation domain-containing protein
MLKKYTAYNTNSLLKNSSGFTFVELLVVMAILAILATITLSVSKYVAKRMVEARQAVELREIESGLDAYKAQYGEYPIPGDPDHYPVVFEVPDSEILPPDYRFIDLTEDAPQERFKEGFGLGDSESVNYDLVYPLYYRQVHNEGKPLVQFDKETICAIIWQDTGADMFSEKTETRKNKAGADETRIIEIYIHGNNINRAIARSAATGYQWTYQCTNGVTYSLIPTNDFEFNE